MNPSVTYRMMQYNILHEGYASQEYLNIGLENRKNNVAAAIRSVSPHVLFLAERFEEWDRRGEGSVDLMASLGEDYRIVENEVSYTDRAGNRVVVTNRTPIVYHASTFRAVDSGFLFLTEEVPTEASGNKRGVTWAILEDITEAPCHGQRIAVFGTHWSTNTHWRTRESFGVYKQAQSEEMQALIRHERFRGLPVVAAGDFNVTYANFYEFYQSLLEACQLSDAAVSVLESPACVVDHIAVSHDFTVLSCCLEEARNASDHNPIYCDIRRDGISI